MLQARRADWVLRAVRPALAEARLINEKHACDELYLATVEEELRDVETQIARLENSLGLPQWDHCLQLRSCRVPAESVAAVREKSLELARRLRRIEHTPEPEAGGPSLSDDSSALPQSPASL